MRILLIIIINNGIYTILVIITLCEVIKKKFRNGLMNKLIIMESITKKKLIIKSDNNKFLY